jgi:ParB family chromosome partitioning protein
MAAHDEFDDFFGDDDATPVADTRADGRLYRVPVARLAPNGVNPRWDFGTQDELVDFGKSLQRRQNQPCPVVSRVAYLKLWPDHADKIGEVDYVLVSGERRYRAANTVGLTTLDCVVNDDFAADRKTFMEAVVSENVDRQNFDTIEEAYAVQALVREFGSNRAVAQHFERADGWVTQRILLTHLAPEVQDQVRAKTIPLDAARTLGKLARDKEWTAEQQAGWWEQERLSRQAASTARKAAKRDPRPATPTPPKQGTTVRPESIGEGKESFTAVKQPVSMPASREPSPSPSGDSGERAAIPPAVFTEASTEDGHAAPATDPPTSVPEQRPEPVQPARPTKMPWEDPAECARIIGARMKPAERQQLVVHLLEQERIDVRLGYVEPRPS